MVRDPQSGKYRRTRLFVLTLGYSRKCVRLLTWRSSVRTWAELHEKAFRRLGGCPKVVVLDNLKEGVAVPDIFDPTVNPLFRDVLSHYGAVALPCRIQDPDRKGKVESRLQRRITYQATRVNPTREGYEMPQKNSGRKVKSHQQMIQALELRAAAPASGRSERRYPFQSLARSELYGRRWMNLYSTARIPRSACVSWSYIAWIA
jgi:hypothetical protein